MASVRTTGGAARPIGTLYALGAAGDLTDGQLLDRFLARDDPATAEAAFAELVDRHGSMVLAVCRRELRDVHDAHDAFQATFLVLVTRAATIRRRDSVGGWLLGIARRVSARARIERERRHRHHQRYGERVRDDLASRPGETEADEIPLLAEVDRLPERYRVAVVLHYFEGLTAEAMARRLGCPRGTVLARLSRARERLRRRLERRSVSPAFLVTASRWLTPEPVPAWLAHGTTSAACSLGLAGAAVESVATSKVAGLSRRVARTLALPRVGGAVPLLLLAFAGVSIGVAATFGTEEKRGFGPVAVTPPRAAANPPAPPARPDEDADSLVMRGRVLDPDGKPVAGARLYLNHYRWEDRESPQPVRATSDRGGRFRFAVPRRTFDRPFVEGWQLARVIAIADGYAVGCSDSAPGEGDAGRELTIRLPRDDVPIIGRVLDLEGRPVAGATVRVVHIFASPSGDLGLWLRAAEAREGNLYELQDRYLKRLRSPPYDRLPEIPPVTTDREGRFSIRGIGRERLVELQIEGPTIRTLEAAAMTREGHPVRLLYFSIRVDDQVKIYHPARFDVTAPPSRPIEGIVRDRDTGQPVAGATICGHRLADQDLGNNGLIETTTDAAGRFRLLGMPLGRGNQVVIHPPRDVPYLPSFRKLDELTVAGPLRVDFALKRGVWIQGRVTDRVTGRPVRASLKYAAARDNPHLADAPGFAEIGRDGDGSAWVITAEDGSYRIAALPGRGVLTAAWDDRTYIRPDIPSKAMLERGDFVPPLSLREPIAEIDVRPGAPSPRCDLALVPALTLTGIVLDPQGRPLTGTRVCGAIDARSWGWPLASERFEVYGFTRPKPRSIGGMPQARNLDATASAILPDGFRLLLFQNESRQLAGWAEVTSQTKRPLEVRLKPWATLAGRMVRPSGEPWSDRAVKPMVVDPIRLDRDAIGHHPDRIYTGPDGRFRVEGLVPGLHYRLMLETARFVSTRAGPGVAPLKPGENRDLGDVVAEVRDEVD